MIKGNTDTTMGWKRLGALFANADDNEQAAFFKEMVAEMQTWETGTQSYMQLSSINAKLTKEEREVLSMIGYANDA